MKNVYTFRNRKINAYGDPFVAVEDKEQQAKNVSRFCLLERDQAKKAHYDESELYFIGTWNDEKGKLEQLDEPEFVCSFDNLFVEQK